MEDGSRLNKLATPKAGFIYPLASSVVPKGFLLCDGSEYSRTEYPELFAAIGTIYGAGDGSTTFNVPNLETRVPVGKGTGYALGASGGEEKHTLTVEEMPSHDHYLPMYVSTGNSKPGASVGYSENCGGTQWATSGYVGNSQPHNNMQPYTVVNYIIATGKNTGVSVTDIVTGAQVLPLGVEYGGTGAINAEDALKNFGAMSMELLWENGKPNNTFGEQSITLDLSEYGMVGVQMVKIAGHADLTSIQFVKKNEAFYTVMSDCYAKLAERGVSMRDDKVMFKNANLANGTTYEKKNDCMIPAAIYGIKGVSA